MWYYDSEIIKTPRTMVISGITHPPGIFKDSSMLSSLGIKPYTETKKDENYYWPGNYSVNTSGSTVVGTYAGTVKDLATLRAAMKKEVRSEEHTSELHSRLHLVCRLLLEKKKKNK